jgi:MerR family transcriptional regulator, thiopeptide resistance regulator
MTDRMTLTIKQLASLAGVSVRTLHYYDEIGLLNPDSVAPNGYRQYSEPAVLLLQQILFYREMDMPLETIRDLVTRPEFDVVRALQAHRISLQEKSKRLDQLIDTIDKTIEHLEGKRTMKQEEYFEGWTEEKQPEFEQEIRQKYGEHAMDEVIDWNSYTKEKKAVIMAEGEANMQSMAFLMYLPPNSPEVQEAVARWHQHMKYFYDPSIERMRGLGQMYVDDPRFNAMYEKVRKGLALFMKQAIDVYCDRLEKK